jgi:alpha-ketoglutarate-dependent taurine dioxygenase
MVKSVAEGLQVRALSPAIGAEISGIDLAHAALDAV